MRISVLLVTTEADVGGASLDAMFAFRPRNDATKGVRNSRA